MNLYGFGGGDPVNFSDPFGLCAPMPWCLLAAAGAGAGGPVALAEVGVAEEAVPVVGQVVGTVTLTAAAGWAVYKGAQALANRREEKQIRGAIKAATGAPATTPQVQCMSQEIHDCKESGDGGTKNKKGDFTWPELVKMAKELFTNKPNP